MCVTYIHVDLQEAGALPIRCGSTLQPLPAGCQMHSIGEVHAVAAGLPVGLACAACASSAPT